MSSLENLKTAFAGESQANRKYLAFAKKAEEEGFPQVAKLFRAAAEAETVHAHAHLRAMDGVKDTRKNLEEAVAGEEYEFKDMYPQFLEEAEKEGNTRAAVSFKHALRVEEIHHTLYAKALSAVQEGKDLTAAPIWVCSICGYTVVGDAPDRCPVCNAPRERLFQVH